MDSNNRQDLTSASSLVKKNILSAEIISHSNEFDPTVLFVEKILIDAIKQGVSDIHFEPYELDYRIRYRHDGLLSTIATPPLLQANRIASRIKIGEKIVIRILNSDSTQPTIDLLGLLPSQKNFFLGALSRPQGMIVVTGPTGSGKTFTLYAALNQLNTGDKNISTVEDPVEIKVNGINQINTNTKAGLTFSTTLRALLRQDPDVLMIGEIRDLETAEIAIKAAHTGHLVLSTLHTNSAAETLTRFLNMGIPALNLASSIRLIIAQRLIRVLCNFCKLSRTDLVYAHLVELGISSPDPKLLSSYKAMGCKQCKNGYHGRMAIFEMMPISKKLSEMIMSGMDSFKLLQQAQQEGMKTLYEAGLQQVIAGISSLEEIHRVMVE